ncbi:MAG: hypothetical protein NTV24_05115 [Candidatus Woesebacteria bacterium]|nr:hypothetical protein [Candidatus Woesebacteria bacterium]
MVERIDSALNHLFKAHIALGVYLFIDIANLHVVEKFNLPTGILKNVIQLSPAVGYGIEIFRQFILTNKGLDEDKA